MPGTQQRTPTGRQHMTAQSAKYVHGRLLGQKLCEAWDLDPKRVTGLTINVECNDVATVTVTFLPSPGGKFLDVLASYRLIEEPEQPDGSECA
jgi:hypothetical protein